MGSVILAVLLKVGPMIAENLITVYELVENIGALLRHAGVILPNGNDLQPVLAGSGVDLVNGQAGAFFLGCAIYCCTAGHAEDKADLDCGGWSRSCDGCKKEYACDYSDQSAS